MLHTCAFCGDLQVRLWQVKIGLGSFSRAAHRVAWENLLLCEKFAMWAVGLQVCRKPVQQKWPCRSICVHTAVLLTAFKEKTKKLSYLHALRHLQTDFVVMRFYDRHESIWPWPWFKVIQMWESNLFCANYLTVSFWWILVCYWDLLVRWTHIHFILSDQYSREKNIKLNWKLLVLREV